MNQFPALHRTKKRTIIFLVYVALILILTWGWQWMFAPAGTCFDKVQNQDETGIDCGGACGACSAALKTPSDIEIRSTQLVYGGVNTYDVVAQIFNPNAEDGASSFDYSFELKDAQGQVITTRNGRGFILPGEDKYIVETQMQSQTIPKSIVFKMSNPNWQHFDGGYKERPALKIYSKNYEQISSGTGFGVATGLLVNESPFDFVNVKVKVLLFDASDKLLAANSTEFQTVRSGQKRDINLIWPTAFPGKVLRAEIEPEADVYHSDNFVKQFFPNTQF